VRDCANHDRPPHARASVDLTLPSALSLCQMGSLREGRGDWISRKRGDQASRWPKAQGYGSGSCFQDWQWERMDGAVSS
jgi:hypothetical protein